MEQYKMKSILLFIVDINHCYNIKIINEHEFDENR